MSIHHHYSQKLNSVIAKPTTSVEEKFNAVLAAALDYIQGLNQTNDVYLPAVVSSVFHNLTVSAGTFKTAIILAQAADQENTNAYHARQHYREGLIFMQALLALHDSIYPEIPLNNEQKAQLLTSYLGHDLKHPGGKAADDFGYEVISAQEIIQARQAVETKRNDYLTDQFMVYSTFPKPLFATVAELETTVSRSQHQSVKDAVQHAQANLPLFAVYAFYMQCADLGPAIALSAGYNLIAEKRMCTERVAKGESDMAITPESILQSHMGFLKFLSTRFDTMQQSPLGTLMVKRIEEIAVELVNDGPLIAQTLFGKNNHKGLNSRIKYLS